MGIFIFGHAPNSALHDLKIPFGIFAHSLNVSGWPQTVFLPGSILKAIVRMGALGWLWWIRVFHRIKLSQNLNLKHPRKGNIYENWCLCTLFYFWHSFWMTLYIVAKMITAHQLQYSMQLLYHHLADPLGDLHHLNDNHQPQIALLASSASIELVSSSARVTSVKSQPKVLELERDTGTHRPDPRDTWVR